MGWLSWLLHLVPMFVTYHVYFRGGEIDGNTMQAEYSYAPEWIACTGERVGEFTVFCWLFWAPQLWEKYQEAVDTHMLSRMIEQGLIPADLWGSKSERD